MTHNGDDREWIETLDEERWAHMNEEMAKKKGKRLNAKKFMSETIDIISNCELSVQSIELEE